MSEGLVVFLKLFALIVIWFTIDWIGDELLGIWSPGERSLPGLIFRALAFGLAYLLLWVWLPWQF